MLRKKTLYVMPFILLLLTGCTAASKTSSVTSVSKPTGFIENELSSDSDTKTTASSDTKAITSSDTKTITSSDTKTDTNQDTAATDTNTHFVIKGNTLTSDSFKIKYSITFDNINDFICKDKPYDADDTAETNCFYVDDDSRVSNDDSTGIYFNIDFVDESHLKEHRLYLLTNKDITFEQYFYNDINFKDYEYYKIKPFSSKSYPALCTKLYDTNFDRIEKRYCIPFNKGNDVFYINLSYPALHQQQYEKRLDSIVQSMTFSF